MISALLISWVLINHYPTPYHFADASPVAPDVVTCQFSPAHYPAFIVCTNPQAMNLSNATISAAFSLSNSPDAVFKFGGQGVWNFGPRPASARLFFSSVIGYANQGTGSTNYWFNSQWLEIGTNSLNLALTATMDPAAWSDAGGCSDCPPPTESDFWSALSNVHEIGIAMGGGDFYDVGITMASGQSTLTMNSFNADPQVTLSQDLQVVGGFPGATYSVEQSEDLKVWHDATNSEGCEFFRAKLQ